MIRRRSLVPPKVPVVYNVKRIKITNTDDQEEVELPSETMIGLLALRNNYDHIVNINGMPPILLKTQIYSYVTNRTEVDRELNQLKINGKILLFKVINQSDEYAILFMDDYLKVLEKAKAKYDNENNFPEFFECFLTIVKQSTDILIETSKLNELLGETGAKNLPLLVRSGLLFRRDKSSFWFGIPGSGRIFSDLADARAEICSIIKRKTRFSEISEQELLKKDFAPPQIKAGDFLSY